MIDARIHKLPKYAYRAGIKPPRYDYGESSRAVFGFDTEYDSETGELLTVQLYRPGFEVYHEVRPGVEFDFRSLRTMLGAFKSPFLVAFFSLADISKLARYWEARLSETGLGFINADYDDLTIFDIGTFWSSDRTFSLAKLGKLIGLPKLSWDRAHVSRASLSESGFREYAMRDAEICYQGYTDFLRATILRLYGVDILHYRSAPTISARIFRRRLTAPVVPPLPSVRRAALRSYWGGRSEIFTRGIVRGQLIEADADSEYPRSAIAIGPLPDGDEWEHGGVWSDYKDGFVTVLFAYPESFTGFYALPVESGGRLYWPRTGRSYCTIHELRRALHHCPDMTYFIRSVTGYRVGSRSEFPDYLAELLDAKGQAVGADRYVYKLLANSVIGKLAQQRIVRSYGEHLTYCGLLGVPPQYVPSRSRPYIATGSCFWPEAASLILGRARACLYDAMQHVGRKRCLVCSTDSVIYKGDPTPFTIDGIPFKIEHTADRLTIWREKFYILEQEDKVVKAAHHAVPGRAVVSGDEVLLSPGALSVDVDYREFVKLAGAVAGFTFGATRDRFKAVKLLPSKWSME